MKAENRIPATGTSTRASGVLIGAFLTALIPLVLLSTPNPAAAENGPATTSERPEDGGQDPVEVTYDEAELQMAGLINHYRDQKGLDPLLVSDTASLAAKRHSEDMARYGYMDHDSQESAYFDNGASFDERLAESGYDHDTALAENIAAGAGVEETFEGWKRSPDHEKNMLDPDMEVIGLGLSTAGDADGSQAPESPGEGEYGSYWTTDFGGKTDRTATRPSKIQPDPDPNEAEPNEPDTTADEEKSPDDTATDDQYGQGSGPEPEEEGSPGDGTGATGGGQDGSGDSGSGEQGATDDQYSTGDEGPVDEGSSKDGSSGEESGDSGEQATKESTIEESTTEKSSGDQGDEGSATGSGGGRECDTLDGFDKSPFDPGFGSELSRLIRAKVDCKLDEAGIGDEERQNERAGNDQTVAGSDQDAAGQDATADSDGAGKAGPGAGGSASGSEPELGDVAEDAPANEPGETAPAVLGPASTDTAAPGDTGPED